MTSQSMQIAYTFSLEILPLFSNVSCQTPKFLETIKQTKYFGNKTFDDFKTPYTKCHGKIAEEAQKMTISHFEE